MNKLVLHGDVGIRSSLFVATTVFCTLHCHLAFAQGTVTASALAARPMRPSGDVLRGLERLKWFAKQQAWDDFAELATQLLANDAQGWILLHEGYYTGAQDAVQRQIAALPAEGLIAYRQRVDGLAATWLRQGIADRDHRLLQKITEEAFCSSSGDDALWALGEIALERGDYTAARLAWRRVHKETAGQYLLAYPDSPIELAAVRARLALVSTREGSFAQARRELAELEQHHPNATGRLAGVKGRFVTTLRRLIDETSQEPPPQYSVQSWPTLAGRYQRANVNDMAPGASDQEKWKQVASQPITEHSTNAADEVVPPPPGFPIVARDQLIFQDAGAIHALKLSSDGKATPKKRGLWKAPHGAPAIIIPTPTANDDRLFAIVPHRAPGQSEWSTQLIGLDLSRDGAIFFRRSPGTAGAVFFGSPLVYRSRVLIAECSVAQGVRMAVACYDVWTGKQLWRRELGSAYTPLSPSGIPLVNVVLSEDSHIVYVNTSAGMIAAVQAEDGAPLWMRTYNRTFAAGQDASLEPPTPNPGILHRGLFIVAPDDARDALGIDAVDGRTIWRTERPECSRLLAAVDGDAILTRDRLWRISLNTGTLDSAYGDQLSAGIGQGVVVGDAIFWPTAAEVLIVSRATGQPTAQALALPAIGGANVIAAEVHPDEATPAKADYYVVAQGRTYLTAWRRAQARDDNSSEPSRNGAPNAR